MIIQDKVYGEQKIDDELVIDLINSPELQRLKGVGQYGTWEMLDSKFNTKRFEHSFGVYHLLKRFGADKDEQIAGLLHDINHTAFSHVVDYVLGDPETQEFGDSKHKDMIMQSTIPSLLNKRDISIKKICDPHNFGLLEREIPDLCCDRIDYFLRDSMCVGLIDKQQANEILEGLIVHNGEIICKNKESASRIARLFLNTSKTLWCNELQAGSFLLLAEALKIAVKKKIVTMEDFYKTDKELFNALLNSKNNEVIEYLSYIHKDALIPGTKEDHDIYSKSKARHIDPKFLENGEIKRLSEVDKEFKKEIDEFKEWVKPGFYLKLKK